MSAIAYTISAISNPRMLMPFSPCAYCSKSGGRRTPVAERGIEERSDKYLSSLVLLSLVGAVAGHR